MVPDADVGTVKGTDRHLLHELTPPIAPAARHNVHPVRPARGKRVNTRFAPPTTRSAHPFATFRGVPARNALTFSVVSRSSRLRAGRDAHATCGVMTQFRAVSSGLSTA